MKKLFGKGLILFIMIGLLVACSDSGDKKVLKMATSADFAPFESYNSDGEMVGFDIELAERIAKELNYELKIEDMKFDGLVGALQANRVDMVMSGMSADEDRKENVDFSIEYNESSEMLLSNKDAPIEDLESLTGKTIGVQLGTIQEEGARRLSEQYDFEVKKIDDGPMLIQELISNRIDVVYMDKEVAQGYIKAQDLFGFDDPTSSSPGMAIAFPKGSNLVDEINKVLEKLEENGELGELKDKWFTTEDSEQGVPIKTEGFLGMNLDFSQIVSYIPFMLKGIGVTLKFVSMSILLGFVLGTILALFKITNMRFLKGFADVYTSIFRGTPLILQLMIFYLAVPQLTGYDISPFLSAVLAFGLNSAAYVSEIIRAGILAVDKGQTEAAEALGIPYSSMMFNIILPQAFKNILPALMNEFITLTKESAIVSVIGTLDLMRRAQVVGSDIYRNFEPLLFVGLIYWLMVFTLTQIGKIVERRMRLSD